LSYRLNYTTRAAKQLRKLPAAVRRRIGQALVKLADNPREHSLKLTDAEGWRLRVGDYRVKFLIADETTTVFVYWVGLREDAYSKKG
jgi:mRNA interferase RelE/StbE